MGGRRFAFLVGLAAAADATCSAQQQILATTQPEDPGTLSRAGFAASNAFEQTRDGIADAAMSPLEDLNLRRDEIPPVLAILDNPYDLPHAVGCYEIAAMINDLDAVLGPDWDASRENAQAWDQRAARGVAGAALNAVSSEASGLIPFRGVVRKLSQAEKHAKSYARAFKIGGQRRAFLKGVGHAKGCIGAAAPQWIAPDGEEQIAMFRRIRPSKEKEKQLAEAEEAKRLEDETLSEPSEL